VDARGERRLRASGRSPHLNDLDENPVADVRDLGRLDRQVVERSDPLLDPAHGRFATVRAGIGDLGAGHELGLVREGGQQDAEGPARGARVAAAQQLDTLGHRRSQYRVLARCRKP
jgi:hypothetical protein